MELHLLKFPWLSELSGNELSLCLAKHTSFLSGVNHWLLPPLPVICRAPALPHLLHPEQIAHLPQPSQLAEKMCILQETKAARFVPVVIPLAKVKLG